MTRPHYVAILDILTTHQPDMDKPCWANERWCKACDTNWQVWPWSDFDRHHADLIAELIENL